MNPLVAPVTDILSALTVAGGVIVVVLLLAHLPLLFRRVKPASFFGWVAQRGILFSLVVAALATAGSLFFSEVAHYAPCKLCWFQRIAMYPLVVILPFALWRRERGTILSSIVLSAIGAALAGYHYAIQVLWPKQAPCSVFDAVPCGQKVFTHFGYITIPMMAFTAFLMILLFLVIHLKRERGATVGA
jgi:disulfide bond formation protein DsbB